MSKNMAGLKQCHFLFINLWIASFCSSASESITHYKVQVSTLLPSASCNNINATTQVVSESSSLKIVHNYGPCSNVGLDKASKPNHMQMLAQDQSRVQSIQAKISGKQGIKDLKDLKADLPAKMGSKTVGSGNYIVKVGLGTPKKDLSLVFDTSSVLTWTQCEPCLDYCYKQQDPIFNPSMSRSYTSISCTSALCSLLTSATGNKPRCYAPISHSAGVSRHAPQTSTCGYSIQYGDSSYSEGFFGKDKLTLTPTETFSNFMFGCGHNNSGPFGGAAGVLGLGRNKLSLVEQTAGKYGKYFSYCLPISTSQTGRLTFGKIATAPISFTPMLTISPESPFYGIRINGITVGETKLPIPSTIFSKATQIIDSGTMITRLPPTAYAIFRDAFRKAMMGTLTAPAFSILDTCYDFSQYESFYVPKVSISFDGPTIIDLPLLAILYVASPWQFCLAFAPNSDDTDVLIYGSVQQQTFTVVHDVAGSKIGFVPNSCP